VNTGSLAGPSFAK